MPQTQSALINAALADVMVLGAGQSPAPENVASVTPRIAPILADLASRRVTPTIDPSAIPDGFFPDLVRVVAQRIATLFGRPVDSNAMQDAEARLRELWRLDRATGTDLVRAVLERIDALGATSSAVDAAAVSGQIQPLLDELTSRRVIALTNEAAVTSAARPHIVTLLVTRLQPKAFDPNLLLAEIQAAEGKLRELARLDRSGTSVLIRTVLGRLEAAGAGSDAVDAVAVAAEIDPALADLSARRIITIANEAAITPEQLPHVALLIAARVQPKAADLPSVQAAEARLREISRLDQSADPLVLGILEQIELYGGGTNVLDAAAINRRLPGILAELSARDVISLDADDLPDAALPDLTRYVAASLANPQLMPIMRDAEARLRRMQAVPYVFAPLRVDYF